MSSETKAAPFLLTERAIKTSSCTQLKASLEAEAMINLGDFGEPSLCPG